MPNDVSDLIPNDGTPSLGRDPKTRYVGGFDRWDYDALAGRAICCSVSNCLTVAADQRGYFWWWDYSRQIWWKHDAIGAKLLNGENQLFVWRMRVALPLIKAFSELPPGRQKDSAYAALSDLAQSVNGAFRRSPDGGGTVITSSDLYSGATHAHAWQIPDLEPPAYDEAIAADLRERDRNLRRSLVDEASAALAKRKPFGSTLGDKLRGLEIDRVEEEERTRRREATQKYFSDLKRQIATFIEAGRVPLQIIVPHEHEAAWGSGVANADLFEEFCDWAETERLRVLVGAWDYGSGYQVGIQITAAANSAFCSPVLPKVEKMPRSEALAAEARANDPET